MIYEMTSCVSDCMSSWAFDSCLNHTKP